MPAAITVAAVCISTIGYAYVGYPLLCRLLGPLRRRSSLRRVPGDWPRVSVLLPLRDESDAVDAKMRTIAEQTYPPERLEAIVVCNGSDAATVERTRAAAMRWLGDRAHVVRLPSAGKAAALNAGAASARGDLLVMTDVRQRLSPDAVTLLVRALDDPALGAVGGELSIEPTSAYWRYEAWVRRAESVAGLTCGLSGALYAVRRDLYRPLPAETILDDVLVPLRVRNAGYRVAVDPAARAYDAGDASHSEFRRKVRTLAGNLQLLALEPSLLAPWHPAWFAFVSHKLLRLSVPFLLVALLLSSSALPAPWRTLFLSAQFGAYALGAIGQFTAARALRPIALLHTFVVLNVAAAVGVGRFLRRGRHLPW